MPLTEILDPRFRPYILPNAPLVTLAENLAWLEGPVWFADHDCLYVSDLPNDRILRWSESAGLSTFRNHAGFPNGHARDRQGRLIGCSHQQRAILRTELDGTITTLASHFEGHRLNAPNDLVCRSDGTIWFTDPHYGINTDYEGGKHPPECPPSLYRLDPATRSLSLMAQDYEGPNGLAFSPNERLLYVCETGRQFTENPTQHINVHDVLDNGTRLSPPRLFHKTTPGFSDGIRVDEHGNVWSSAGNGVHCLAPDGTLLGRINTPATVSNLAFGGRNRARLYICASHTLMAIYTNTRGVPLL